MPLQGRHAAFFETVIRYLGGLLSAYALSHDPILLSRADDLGTALLPVFDTPSGLPLYAVNPVTGETASGWTGGNTILSEALSCQLEYKYLAYLTGRTQYHTAVEKIMDHIYTTNFSLSRGLLPTMFSTKSGEPIARKSTSLAFWPLSTSLLMTCVDMVSVGAFADSAYEYLLKQWLLSGRTDTKARDLCMTYSSFP
jgi:mannosyl-oligosaccharide alpha-1,2-mannosidase